MYCGEKQNYEKHIIQINHSLQHTFCRIWDFSGITVLIRIFVKPKIIVFKTPKTRQSAGTLRDILAQKMKKAVYLK